MAIVKKHYGILKTIYNNILTVNLVNGSGREGVLKKEYEQCLREIGLLNSNYFYFDFHKQCGHLKWDKINILIDKLLPHVLKDGLYIFNKRDKKTLKLQNAIIRTNCIDCLDRTNVFQSTMTKILFNYILSDDENYLDSYKDAMNSNLKTLWADNADIISKQYSGTGALKTDYTRTGMRSWKGVMLDGFKSAFRYYINNFKDGRKQDAQDFFFTKLELKKNIHIAAMKRTKMILTALIFLGAWFLLMNWLEKWLTMSIIFASIIAFLLLFSTLVNPRNWLQFPSLRNNNNGI